MSQTKQVELPQFGDKIQIEMKRYGVNNELFTHKVVNTQRSNTWVDVPVQSPATEVMHDHMEDVVSAICEGVGETEVLKYRVKDVRIIHSVAQAQQEAASAERERIKTAWEKLNIVGGASAGQAGSMIVRNPWGETDGMQVDRQAYREFIDTLRGKNE